MGPERPRCCDKGSMTIGHRTSMSQARLRRLDRPGSLRPTTVPWTRVRDKIQEARVTEITECHTACQGDGEQASAHRQCQESGRGEHCGSAGLDFLRAAGSRPRVMGYREREQAPVGAGRKEPGPAEPPSIPK